MTVLLRLGALGLIAFVVTFLVDGATRPGYAPMRHPVSALALGPRGRLQTANFLVCGTTVSASAVPLAHGSGSLLLAVLVAAFGLSLVASGLLPMDPMRGYPPGAADGTPTQTSARHRAHDAAGALVFTALPAAALVAAFVLPSPGWRGVSVIVAVLLALGVVAFGEAWEKDSPRAGLLQRAVIILGWSWLAAVLLMVSVP
ncbi:MULTISPECIES: DUF998 domain-containing protein [unclassified Serinicoccus]|uniref:DUF998 domain-containing protein n=1 Tax=unclassified Serinicoccus TaxID=2643101 RepID=UPI0038546E8A